MYPIGPNFIRNHYFLFFLIALPRDIRKKVKYFYSLVILTRSQVTARNSSLVKLSRKCRHNKTVLHVVTSLVISLAMESMFGIDADSSLYRLESPTFLRLEPHIEPKIEIISNWKQIDAKLGVQLIRNWDQPDVKT